MQNKVNDSSQVLSGQTKKNYSNDNIDQALSCIKVYNSKEPGEQLHDIKLTTGQVIFLGLLVDSGNPEEYLEALNTIYESTLFFSSIDLTEEGKKDLYTIHRLIGFFRMLVMGKRLS